MDYLSDFIDGIREYTQRRGISINAFCKGAGIAESGFSLVVKGNVRPSTETLVKAADFIGCPTDWLLGRSDRETFSPSAKGETFIDRFLLLKTERGFTQSFIAKSCGIAETALSKWKRGKVPKPETLISLSETFGCSVDYLLGRSDAR